MIFGKSNESHGKYASPGGSYAACRFHSLAESTCQITLGPQALSPEIKTRSHTRELMFLYRL